MSCIVVRSLPSKTKQLEPQVLSRKQSPVSRRARSCTDKLLGVLVLVPGVVLLVQEVLGDLVDQRLAVTGVLRVC